MSFVVQLMGTVRLVHDGQPVDVGGPKQQAVLAVLALSAGRRVSTDRLVDLVWDENPPPSARRTVQSYVASLRGAFGSKSALEPSQNGYMLNLDRGQVDLLVFEDKVVDLLAGAPLKPDDRAQGLAAVLSTWETPLDGLHRSSRLAELSAPFEELRLQAIEGLVVAQIAGTGSGDAVKMLEALVREHPTRENLWLALARGLNRLGRRDAALNAIQRARESLRQHLGVHPSALLAAFETDLLTDQAEPRAHRVGHSAEQAPGIHAAPVELAGLPGNLPTPLSSFIGRADEIVDIVQCLTGSRLVTLRGLGGIGKTSLALRVAADQAAEFEDGAWFIDVANVARAAAMSERFLTALGLRSRAELAPLDQLLKHLRPLRALLIVDNCEQRIDEISQLLEQIVHVAPDLHVLTTSRNSLAVAGEAVWQVGPLDTAAAIELFAERAHLARPNFELSDTNRRVIERVCEKLDGIPLAIELAAARLSFLGLDQILEHLDDRFGLLGDHAPLRRDNKRTLQSALDWSYELLDEHERSLLRRLEVFPAGFTLEAAKEICAEADSDVGLVNSLRVLVEASLVNFEASDADPRYWLLETVREYAAQMGSASERDKVAREHATYYVELASRIAVLHETDHISAMEAGDRELDNLRAAMAYAFAHNEPEWGLSITRNLHLYFFDRSMHRERLRWLQAGVEQADPEADEGMLAIANALGAAVDLQDNDVAQGFAERVKKSIDLARNPTVRSRLLSSYAAHLGHIDPRAADELFATATDLVKSIDPIATIRCVHSRQWFAWITGDLPHAAAMIADLNDLPDGPLVRRERMLVEIQAAACAGMWQEVVDTSLEPDELGEEILGEVLHLRAEALGALGRIDDAILTLDQIDDLERREDLAGSNSQLIRATTELRRGNAAKAKSLLAESAESLGGDSDRIHRMYIAANAGVTAHQLGADETATRHFGHARALATEFDINMRMSERPLIEQASQQCRATLGADRFDELANLGSTSTWASLVELLHAI